MNNKLLFKITSREKQILWMSIIISLIIIIDFVVFITGGTVFAYTHAMYIPIIISAAIWGVKGGIGTAILAGVSLGPFMPADVSEGVMQTLNSCILRTVFFIIIGLTVSLLIHRIKMDREVEIKKLYEHISTGYPNSNKLRIDLNEMINEKKSFSLIIIKIVNLNYINRYVDYRIGKKSVLKVLDILTNFFNSSNIYSIHTDEMTVTLRGCNVEDACSKAKEFLNYFTKPIFIDELPVDLVIKCGIINFPLHTKEVNDLLLKMDRTLDQEQSTQNRICIYEDHIAQKMRENYETVVSLFDAIKNDKFIIVYQPKIDLKNNEIMGVEALLRWNNGTKGNMNPGEFIKIAEDAEIISEITKWVIKNVIDQLIQWREDGFKIKIAINISSKDLRDNSIIEYTRNCIQVNQIEPSMLEFELTERTIVENENQAEYLLNKIKNIGVKISLDDFGTGYNSLIHLSKLPIDYIKIDKIFIDNIKDIQTRSLIEGTINLIHGLGKKVIVEGVETEEQVAMLSNMGCDNIQGYYFSRPLPPEEIKQYILSFNN